MAFHTTRQRERAPPSAVARRSVRLHCLPHRQGSSRLSRTVWDTPHQLKVEETPGACGAAVRELSSSAEPRTCGLADGLGLGEGLVTCARPARIRLSPHRAARPRTGWPGWRELDLGAAPHLNAAAGIGLG